VLLLLEPALYGLVPVDGEQVLYSTLSKCPFSLRYLSLKQTFTMAWYIGPVIKENLQYGAELCVRKRLGKKTILEETNQYGDYVGHEGKVSIYKPSLNGPVLDQPAPAAIRLIETAERRIRERGARLRVGFAPMARSEADRFPLREIENSIPQEFRLGTIESSIWPDEFFFDTSHHLLFDKRSLRVDQLISDLKVQKLALP